MTGYLLCTDGLVKPMKIYCEIENIVSTTLNPSYSNKDGVYMVPVPVYDDPDVGETPFSYMLLMHEDNDEMRDPMKSTLPNNQVLKQRFPESPYVGDILMVCVTEEDEPTIIDRPFDVHVVFEHLEMYCTSSGILSPTFGFRLAENEDDLYTDDDTDGDDGDDPIATNVFDQIDVMTPELKSMAEWLEKMTGTTESKNRLLAFLAYEISKGENIPFPIDGSGLSMTLTREKTYTYMESRLGMLKKKYHSA